MNQAETGGIGGLIDGNAQRFCSPHRVSSHKLMGYVCVFFLTRLVALETENVTRTFSGSQSESKFTRAWSMCNFISIFSFLDGSAGRSDICGKILRNSDSPIAPGAE